MDAMCLKGWPAPTLLPVALAWPLLSAVRPEVVRAPPPSSRPVGIVAVVLALAIAFGAGWGVRVYARRLADRHVRAVSAGAVPFKYQTLTLQRAAFASGHVLPIYGSSELTCCGSPHLPTQLFASEPTGFGVFAVGWAGTADLFFMETFAALGRDLNGKKLVVSDSPPWFYNRDGLSRAEYAGTFVPEITYAFVFDAPISAHVRQVGARRMLAYPGTLRDRPLLHRAVEDLAHPTPMHLAEYVALAPLGHLATWVLQVRDALRTVVFVRRQRWRHPHPPPRRTSLGWVRLAARGTKIAERRDTSNPFGFPDATYRLMRDRPRFQRILGRYQAGQTNRDGRLFPPPTDWEAATSGSAEWTDLQLELRVLRELGARPLLWSLPMPGVFDDYTPLSAAARQGYYDRYERVVGRARVPWLDFRADDEDRYFLTDTGSHLSARGWVFADRALDMFWQGRSIDAIRAALETLRRQAPPPPVPSDAGAGGASATREVASDSR